MDETPEIHGGTGIPWQDQRILALVRSDERIWDMGMRIASIPVVAITTDGRGEIITDGPLPTPTDEFARIAGFEYVRRGGQITADIDAFSIARATLAIRCWPMEELLQLRDEFRTADAAGFIDPSGNGPMESPSLRRFMVLYRHR